jgi:hypothetical protein
VCDWTRFGNRKQSGSYTGCGPGGHSSSGQRRLGSMDQMGNGRVRALLVEVVWRFLLWQPGWKAAHRLKGKLAAGPALKKKMVVALARQRAIDLWRWRTGRCTLADLGLIAAYCLGRRIDDWRTTGFPLRSRREGRGLGEVRGRRRLKGR